MVNFSKNFTREIGVEGKKIYVFDIEDGNIDNNTVASFGEEWKKFGSFQSEELRKMGDEYFDILPASIRNNRSQVLDAGCGTGRWAAYLAPDVAFIECIDPSEAVFSAAHLLHNFENTRISKVGIDNLPFENDSFDLVYSIGVLHHIPDTFKALQVCVAKVKKGGYFLTYLYYSLDKRGLFFRSLFQVSNFLRKNISKLPGKPKRAICDILAVSLYLPFIGLCRTLKKLGVGENVRKRIPLFAYENKSFHIIRNDALDRFGTPLEQRFTKNQIRDMMEKAGLEEIIFSEKMPYWHAVGRKT